MSYHKVEIIIKNHTTGEEASIIRADEEYAIIDPLKPAFEELLRQYRERYPVGLRLFKNVN
jgi:hypothetical protein